MEMRKQIAAKDFTAQYKHYCRLLNAYPVTSICSAGDNGVLSCPVYRLVGTDWEPILTALRQNQTLHTILVYDRWRERVSSQLEGAMKNAKPLSKTRASYLDRYTTTELVKSVSECLGVSGSVQSLALEGTELTLKDMKCLVTGLNRSRSMKHISLKGSRVGDRCIEVLCEALRDNSSCVQWLDLTYCSLTSTGAASLASLIKHQCFERRNTAWRESLRDRRLQSSATALPGLQRVTLNLNPLIGDDGALDLANALQDDLWIKALDLQFCSLSNTSALTLLEMLHSNTTLMVLDLRDNQLIDDSVLENIHEQLTVNMATNPINEEPHKFLDLEADVIKRELRRNGLTTTNLRQKKKQVIKKTSSLSHSTAPSELVTLPKREPGVPWRTAARNAQRCFALCPTSTSAPNGHKVGSAWRRKPADLSEEDEDETEEEEEGEESSEDGGETPPMRLSISSSKETRTSSQVVLSVDQFRQLQEEIIFCHTKLREETAKVIELETQNRELRERVVELEEAQQATRPSLGRGSINDLTGDTLEAVETTFQQFHAFLDMLSEKGSKDLSTLVNCS